jgi:hypothetical protein
MDGFSRFFREITGDEDSFCETSSILMGDKSLSCFFLRFGCDNVCADFSLRSFLAFGVRGGARVSESILSEVFFSLGQQMLTADYVRSGKHSWIQFWVHMMPDKNRLSKIGRWVQKSLICIFAKSDFYRLGIMGIQKTSTIGPGHLLKHITCTWKRYVNKIFSAVPPQIMSFFMLSS